MQFSVLLRKKYKKSPLGLSEENKYLETQAHLFTASHVSQLQLYKPAYYVKDNFDGHVSEKLPVHVSCLGDKC